MPSRVVGSSSWAPGSDHTQGLAHHSLPGPRGFLRRGGSGGRGGPAPLTETFLNLGSSTPPPKVDTMPGSRRVPVFGKQRCGLFSARGCAVQCSACCTSVRSPDRGKGEKRTRPEARRQKIAGRAAAPLRAVAVAVAWHRRGLNSPSVSLPPVLSHGWSLLPSRRLVLGHAAALPPPAMITDLLPTAHAAHVERQNSSPATGLSISFLFPNSSPLDTRAVLFTAVAIDNRLQGASHGSRPRPSGVIRFGSPRGLCKS
jgi:hypothetical protein